MKGLFYENRLYPLSNFSADMVEWEGVLWPTSEHAYQASKFIDPALRLKIQHARSPREAKSMAKAHDESRRLDWSDDLKLGMMEEILRCKVAQHSDIADILMRSGVIELIEDSPFDNFWGRGKYWKGQNHLGKLWMKIRNDLRTAL